MIPPGKDHQLTIKEIKTIIEAVHKVYNFDFSNYAFSSLQRRLNRIITLYKFKSVNDLIEKLSVDKIFFGEFLEEITVNTTEMFRDPEMWRILRQTILKKIEHKSFINIWHAGCSSGEEVFSMAILLKEMGIYDKCKLLATDINKSVIERAKSGVYAMRNMELNSENYLRAGGKSSLENYFEVENSTAIMHSDLLSNVSFRVHNLAMDSHFAKFDIILCRNVLIYFDKDLQERVFSLFTNSLLKQGFFIIGSKESMVWSSFNSKYKLINNKEKIYQLY